MQTFTTTGRTGTAEATRTQRLSLKNRLWSYLKMALSVTSYRPWGGSQSRCVQVGPDTASAGTGPHWRTVLTLSSKSVRLLRRSNRDTEMLSHSIRGKIATLPRTVGERFAHQLQDILGHDDAQRRLALLTTLEATVTAAHNGPYASVPGNLQAPPRRSLVLVSRCPASDRD